MKKLRFLLISVMILVCVKLDVSAQTSIATHGRLSVKSCDVVDSKGKKFQLRGISTHGINWDVGYPYVNKAIFVGV